MTIRALSFDFDGCLFNMNYITSRDKDVLRDNRNFLNGIRSTNHLHTENHAFVGSNRQDYATDMLNARMNTDARGSCFPAFTRVCEHLNVTQNNFLMADLNNGMTHGRNFQYITTDSERADEYNWVFDETKTTILYAQMHKMASEHPNEAIVFDFFDDRDDILDQLRVFFTRLPDLIPKNVTLRLNHYNGADVTLRAEIRGADVMIDKNYEATVRAMTARSQLIDSDHLPVNPVNPMATVRRAEQNNSATNVGPNLLDILSRDMNWLPREALNVVNPISAPIPERTFTGRVAFEAQLAIIQEKTRVLRKEGHTVAANAADDLHAKIRTYADPFFANTLSERLFRKQCADAINDARPALEQFGWKEILGNLALAILGLGVVYLVACVINKAVTGHFLFFRMDAAQKLDMLEDKLEQIAIRAA